MDTLKSEGLSDCDCGTCRACKAEYEPARVLVAERPKTTELHPLVAKVLNYEPMFEDSPPDPKPIKKAARPPRVRRKKVSLVKKPKRLPRRKKVSLIKKRKPKPRPVKKVSLIKKMSMRPYGQKRSDAYIFKLTPEEDRERRRKNAEASRRKIHGQRIRKDDKWFHPDAPHGEARGASYYGCNCDLCYAALKEQREQRGPRVYKKKVSLKKKPPPKPASPKKTPTRRQNYVHTLTPEENRARLKRNRQTTRANTLAKRVRKDGRWFHPDAKHGTLRGVKYYGCNCTECGIVSSAYKKKRKENKLARDMAR